MAKIERYLSDMMKYSRLLNKSFDKASKEDIRDVIGKLEQTDLSPETKKCFKIMLRKLYRSLAGIDEKGVYPEKVKWISIAISNSKKKLPEELITEEEATKIIQKCKYTRDKALISMLYESGCRVGEIGSMQIKHIAFEEHGVRLTVNGKTGMRKILVISSAPYIQRWINQHQNNDNPESPLWVDVNGKMICYTRISAILKEAAKRAGIKKKIHAHLLRHSRATYMANKMSEAAMKQYFGWTQGSKMAATYIHMSGKDTDDAILRANGISITTEIKKSAIEPKKCLRCNTLNEVTNKFCNLCGMPLTKDEAERIIKEDLERKQTDEMMNKIVSNKDMLEMLVKRIAQVN